MATESGYNRDLQLIVEVRNLSPWRTSPAMWCDVVLTRPASVQVFYAPLLPLLVDKALAVIFANVEDILLANTAFLSSLEQRQRNCRLYVDTVGDILEEHMPAMGIYTVCSSSISSWSRPSVKETAVFQSSFFNPDVQSLVPPSCQCYCNGADQYVLMPHF